MKKMIFLGLILVASLSLVVLPVASAWQWNPGGDYWYINAQSEGDFVTGPLVIELNEDSTPGQMFLVGGTVTITVDVYAVSQSAAGGWQEVFSNAQLSVTGPSGSDSDQVIDDVINEGEDWAIIDYSLVPLSLSISYPLTTPGTHTVYANSYVAVAQYYSDVGDETVDALLTFEVVETKADVLKGNGVPGKGIDNAPGLQKAVPNDNFAKGTAK